jgi:hypothetical protein
MKKEDWVCFFLFSLVTPVTPFFSVWCFYVSGILLFPSCDFQPKYINMISIKECQYFKLNFFKYNEL